MSQKITDEATGEEIEVFTAAEVQARETAAGAAVRTEFEPKVADLTGKLTAAEEAAAKRAGEFGEFRKLNEEQVAALAEKERIIYENTLRLKEADDARVLAEQNGVKAAVNSAIKAKAGENPKLIEKINEMWEIIQVEATTPEQIDAKLTMVLGAISTTQPDLLSTVNGFGGGSYQPPVVERKEGESFADTEAGKNLAKDLGITL